MARNRRQDERSSHRDSRSDLEGGFWIVDLLICVLAGSITGIVASTGDFSSPWKLAAKGWGPLVSSGWGQLAFVAMLLVAMMLAARWLKRAVRRRVQVCVLLSLLVHSWLAMLLCAQHLPFMPPWATDLARLVLDEPAWESMPDYHWEQTEQPEAVRDFERPVQTEAPVVPERARAEQKPIEYRPSVEQLARTDPGVKLREKPDPTPIQRAELPAPRRNEETARSELGRQELQNRLDAAAPIPEPKIKPPDPERAAELAARALMQRQLTPIPAAPPRAVQAEPERRSAPAPLARQTAAPQPEPELLPIRGPRRELTRPENLVETEAEAPQPTGGIGEAPPVALEAKPTVTRRRSETPDLARDQSATVPAGVLSAGPTARQPRRGAERADLELELATAAGTYPLPRQASSADVLTPGPVTVEPAGSPAAPEGRNAGLAGVGPAATDVERVSTAPASIAAGPSAVGDNPDMRSPPPLVSATGRPARTAFSPPGDERPAIAGARALGRSNLAAGLPGLSGASDELRPLGPSGAGPMGPSQGRPAGTAELDSATISDNSGPDRQLGGPAVQIAAATGPGGLGRDLSPTVGIRSRQARPESDVVHDVPGRFVIQKSGGRLPIDANIREAPAAAFRQRDPSRRGQRARSFGGTPESERAVESGIEFLARHQFPDGHWSLDRVPQGASTGNEDFAPGEMQGDTAATGLALLAFLGAGYTHLDGKYEAGVRRGVEWLLRNQQPDGSLFTAETDQTRFTRFYGHAIGSIALCEAYGMTGDPNLREPARKAIRFICESQDPSAGGWRYEPRNGSDTSVSGWKVMALKSAQMAGLEVPAGVLQRVAKWLDAAQAEGGARYAYNPFAPDTPEQREGREPNLAMTAEGLLMRVYLGSARGNPALTAGARHLLDNLPEEGTAENPRRDAYYWYYATQVMFQLQGDSWRAWYGRLRPMLEKGQVTAGPLTGSWHPTQPVRDRWAHAGGRLYVTALSLLMLEVPYRHLPLYQQAADAGQQAVGRTP